MTYSGQFHSNGVVEEFRHPNGLGILRADVVSTVLLSEIVS